MFDHINARLVLQVDAAFNNKKRYVSLEDGAARVLQTNLTTSPKILVSIRNEPDLPLKSHSH